MPHWICTMLPLCNEIAIAAEASSMTKYKTAEHCENRVKA
jgi:hypothetical protein